MFGGLMWLIAVLVVLVIGGFGLRAVMVSNRRRRALIDDSSRPRDAGGT